LATSTTAQEVAKRNGKKSTATLLSAFAAALRADSVDLGLGGDKSIQWPCVRYQKDPVAFCREILGVEPWGDETHGQIAILNAVCSNKRVAVKSGHKVSKSNSAAALALWFYCSFPDARVIMSSVTDRQVNQILWREVRKTHQRARLGIPAGDAALQRNPNLKTYPIGGSIKALARSGLKSEDFREVVGFTAKEAEAMAGTSGANLLYILDEASGIEEDIFEAIEGNRAAGALIVLFSNPTRNEGEFFEAFNSKRKSEQNPTGYHCITISSEDTPNCKENRVVIPGLAGRDWVEEKKVEWGVDSSLYAVRVKGEFATKEEGKILPLHQIMSAINRFSIDEVKGDLQIGLDPAGPGTAGDEGVFAVRRGNHIIALYPCRGLTEEMYVGKLLEVFATHRKPREPVTVCIDREGPIGSKVWSLLRDHNEHATDRFVLVAVRASDKAQRLGKIYDRMRDELWANLALWVRSGGALIDDSKLLKELHTPSWIQHISGRLKATDKKEMKKTLHRSPDRADATALAVWCPVEYQVDDGVVIEKQVEGLPEIDPYSGLDCWR